MGTRILSEETDVSRAFRPFDADANGYVPGEGGAILLVEDLERARERGAKIYGEIVGYGATQDAYHYVKPAPDCHAFSRAMSLALQSANVSPEQVDAVFADAGGTRERDALEAAAILKVFGDHGRKVPVTAPKSMVGRLYAGGAPLDTAAALLSMRDGCLPPTINLDRPAEGCDLNFVTGATQSAKLNTILINARGLGGFNSSLVIRAV
jgi:3-oxoacyl-(acyl-carrier-protein) synthase